MKVSLIVVTVQEKQDITICDGRVPATEIYYMNMRFLSLFITFVKRAQWIQLSLKEKNKNCKQSISRSHCNRSISTASSKLIEYERECRRRAFLHV